MKRCTCCGETKPLEDFYRRARSADGRQAYCKTCSKSQNRAWVADNRDRHNERNLAFYHRHKGSVARAKWAAIAAEAAAEA